MTTDVRAFIGDLDAGVLESKMSRALSDCAAAAIDHGAPAKLKIELTIARIGSSYQVAVDQTLTYTRPTSTGNVSETTKTSTPMHVGTGGKMSFFPENQSQMFGIKGEVIFDKATGEIRKE